MYKNIDILSFFHFLTYLIIGKYFKNNYLIIIIFSFAWEQFEYIISRNTYIRKQIENIWPIPSNMWYDTKLHSLIDISFNLIGYYIGNTYLT